MNGFTIIAAFDNNNLIGKNNQLPWHIPEDLKFFKKQTMGKTILMGRKTCESLPFPLPGRKNIVLSRNKNYRKEGFEIIHNITDKLLNEEIIVIGGSAIYELLLPMTSQLILTRIDHEFDGDSYFPEIDWTKWTNIKTSYLPKSASQHAFDISFEFYERTLNN